MKRVLLLTLLLVATALFAQNSPLTITSPNGGEVWEIGTTQSITWMSSSPVGAVSLQLIGNSTNQIVTVAQNIPVFPGVFTWTIPNNIMPSSYYRMRITMANAAGTTATDTSDGMFSIVSGTTPPPPPPTYLYLTSPNGGEVWQTSSIHPITWESSGLEGEVRISLLQNNAPEIVIAPNVPVNNGVFHWNIPATLPLSNNYRVHIVWLTILAVYIGDQSDQPFSVVAPTPPPMGLNITSPNGGETWVAGTMHPITWTSADYAGNVMLQLFNGMNTAPLLTIAENVPAHPGVFQWNVPSTLIASQNYYIRISTIDPAGVLLQDFSDAPFTISAGNNTLVQVLSPNGGEVWQKGNTYPITWASAMLSGNYEVALMQGSSPQPVFVIEQSFPGIMALNWTIPDNIPPAANYKIRVRIAANNGAFDISDGFFTIEDSGNPPVSHLVVTSPNGGEIWVKGTTQTISWTSDDLTGNVNIWLGRIWQNQRQRRIIASGVANTGSYSWTVPMRVPAGHGYMIYIRKTDNASERDVSDQPFSIIGNINNVEAAPNPTNEETAIKINVQNPVLAEIYIYNLKGQKVRSFTQSNLVKGDNRVFWDGKDSRGQRVHNGIYFIRVEAGGEVFTRKLIVVK
jgi:hypothetical protein